MFPGTDPPVVSDDSDAVDGDHPLLDPDALAGVVDLFGALTRAELAEAVGELAFKRGTRIDPETVERAVDDAITAYALVVVDGDNGGDGGETDRSDRLVVGPTAFPRLPDGAADLPHILETADGFGDGHGGALDGRETDRDAIATAVESRLRGEAARAAAAGDDDRLETLLDVCFDVDVWAGTDTSDVRADIERALD